MLNACPQRGTVLGFDFGLQRIGIAVGSLEVGIAHPLETIHDERNEVRFGRIAQLIAEWRPVSLVVGLPFHVDGEAHDMTRRCQRFANQLHGRYHLPVHQVDERLTSVAAEQQLTEARVFGAKRKQRLDQVAAQQILQSYFDARSQH